MSSSINLDQGTSGLTPQEKLEQARKRQQESRATKTKARYKKYNNTSRKRKKTDDGGALSKSVERSHSECQDRFGLCCVPRDDIFLPHGFGATDQLKTDGCNDRDECNPRRDDTVYDGLGGPPGASGVDGGDDRFVGGRGVPGGNSGAGGVDGTIGGTSGSRGNGGTSGAGLNDGSNEGDEGFGGGDGGTNAGEGSGASKKRGKKKKKTKKKKESPHVESPNFDILCSEVPLSGCYMSKLYQEVMSRANVYFMWKCFDEVDLLLDFAINCLREFLLRSTERYSCELSNLWVMRYHNHIRMFSSKEELEADVHWGMYYHPSSDIAQRCFAEFYFSPERDIRDGELRRYNERQKYDCEFSTECHRNMWNMKSSEGYLREYLDYVCKEETFKLFCRDNLFDVSASVVSTLESMNDDGIGIKVDQKKYFVSTMITASKDEYFSCKNCCRKICCYRQLDGMYNVNMYSVGTYALKSIRTPLRRVVVATNQDTSKAVMLCSECHAFLHKTSTDRSRWLWKNVWPSFFWDLLIGNDVESAQPFTQTYEPSKLWGFIPPGVRQFWIEALQVQSCYSEIDLNEVPSVFEDRSDDIRLFWQNIKEYTFRGMLAALDPERLPDNMLTPEIEESKPMIIPDVLCPWGCSEYSFQAKEIDLSLLIQNQLRLVQLNMAPKNYDKMYLVEGSRQDYVRRKGEELDFVLLNREWTISPSVRLIPGSGLVGLVCRHHSSTNTQRRLYPHPPRKVGDNLSATRVDELAHARLQPRIAKGVRRKVCGTTPPLHIRQNHYTGSDSANVSIGRPIGGHFSGLSAILHRHEVLSIAGRQDINKLAHKMVDEDLANAELLNEWMEGVEGLYGSSEDERREVLDPLIRGSTYTPTFNAIILQMLSSERNKIQVELLQRVEGKQSQVIRFIDRSWVPVIYNMQVEDGDGYGWPVKAVPQFRLKKEAAPMMAWVMTAIVSGCNDVHYLMDQKVGGHSYRNYSGHLLAFIHSKLMKHCERKHPHMSPFAGSKGMQYLHRMIELDMPSDMKERVQKKSEVDEDFYQFSFDYMSCLFPRCSYPNISVVQSQDEMLSRINASRSCDDDVFIIVSDEKPSGSATITIDGSFYKQYEARQVIAISILSGEDRKSRSSFNAIRYTRHGGSYRNWWKQRRVYGQGSTSARMISTQYRMPDSNSSCDDPYPDVGQECFKYVVVFVSTKKLEVEKYKKDIHKSFGGQCDVQCDCQKGFNGLIVSGARRGEARVCMRPGCERPEKYRCPVLHCPSCICNECFLQISKSEGGYHITEGERDGTASASFSGGGEDRDSGPKNDADEDSVIDYNGMEDVDENDNLLHTSDYDDVFNEEFPTAKDEYDHEEEGEQVGGEEDENEMDDDENLGCGRGFQEDYEFMDGEGDDSPITEDEDARRYHRSYASKNELLKKTAKVVDGLNMEHLVSESESQFILSLYLSCSLMKLCKFKLTASEYDLNNSEQVDEESENIEEVPWTNSGEQLATVLERQYSKSSSSKFGLTVPMHVLFNQAGRLCSRWNKPVKGTQVQQSFVQRIASNITAFSVPLLYLSAMLFPKHFWASANDDCTAILGAAPISCYTKETHPAGFASTLEVARNLQTHASSSTSTDNVFTAHLYDIQANRAAANLDSRLIRKNGFKVSTTSASGLELAEGDRSGLEESVDSTQSVMNLAASAEEVSGAFVTYTCNQSQHPGIRHLYRWKESKDWTCEIVGYDQLSQREKFEYEKSFEMAYSGILSRSWFEVRKLWIHFIMFSTSTMLGRTVNAFFRDEYQEESGNLAHIHGLFSLSREEMNNEEFMDFMGSLQRNAVCDLITGSEVSEYIEKGLVTDEDDWREVTSVAKKVLSHTCDSRRCLMRVAHTGDTEKDYVCKKKHPVFDSVDCDADDLIPLPFDFSDMSLDVLEKVGLYDPPDNKSPKGVFNHKMLDPKRHMGRVTPSARENASPVTPEHFAFTRSMQNFQVIYGTNGVARYVVKYIVKLDKGNRCIIWSDCHTGAVLRAEHNFLHNTKIARSEYNEEKAFEASRARNHPVGTFIAFPQMVQHLLGECDVHTNLSFVNIQTTPFEYRARSNIRMDRNGNLYCPNQNRPSDNASTELDAFQIRNRKLGNVRQFTPSQYRLIKPNTAKSSSYDHVTLFGLRPPEMLELFPNLGNYWRWTTASDEQLDVKELEDYLESDVRNCGWVDAIGRKITLRNSARNEVRTWLESINPVSLVSNDAKILRNHLLTLISRDDQSSKFFSGVNTERLPTAVYSNVTPNRPANFLLHVMLTLGSFETELDLKNTTSLKHSLAVAKLIPPGVKDPDLNCSKFLEKWCRYLVNRIISDVMSVLPISMRKLDEYIVKVDTLVRSVLHDDAIPITDLPPCILTDILLSKREDVDNEWTERTRAQLKAMKSEMKHVAAGLPTDEDIMNAKKHGPISWNPLEVIRKHDGQSVESYKEQQASLSMGINAVNKYCRQFQDRLTHTKGVLTHGTPGAGKTFVLESQGLYAMTQGLRVLSTSLMSVRANELGGYHIHRLFGLDVGKKVNIHRLAELAVDKLHRKSKVKFLNLLLTMDVLLLDECGQLSAEQLSLLDIILRNLRHNNIPFGGVLIFGTFDYCQLGAIDGLPFLLSSHILTDFTLIELRHSVRASKDDKLKEIQNITRMSPTVLNESEVHAKRFRQLVEECVTFLPSWESTEITPDFQRMYSRKKPANDALQKWTDQCITYLKDNDLPYEECESSDWERIEDSLSRWSNASSADFISALDHKSREPKKLLFYEGAMFESTTNTNCFGQSQLLIMTDLPSKDTIKKKEPIKLWAVNSGIKIRRRGFGVPYSRLELKEMGCTEVDVDICAENCVTRRGITGYRKQYTLRHIGSSTVNKQMGNTIDGPVAIEVTEKYSPWERGQIVVMLSRTTTSKHIFIVGEKNFAIDRMYSVLCKRTQWTALEECIIANLSTVGENMSRHQGHRVVDYATHFPYYACDVSLPTSATGYVYMLLSTVNQKKVYIGQTEHIGKRLNEHNRGSGALGTASVLWMPWCVASYICNMQDMCKSEREYLEARWKHYNDISMTNGQGSIEQFIENGVRVTQEYNMQKADDEQLNYIKCIAKHKP